MNLFPISYAEPVYRPPSEGQSLLLQVTIGCSNNKCTYCAMYRSKNYKIRTLEEIFSDIDKLKANFKGKWFSGKVFLCDGDALGAPTATLVAVTEYIRKAFPDIRRFGIYSTAENILEKSEKDLKILGNLGLSIGYLGMESGCDKVLKMVVKGNTAEEMLTAGLKLKNCGWKISVIGMLGIGGRKHSASHCQKTAEIIRQMVPQFFSFLTTVPIPGTPYARMVDKKLLQILTSKELLVEMKTIILNMEPLERNIIFRANHVSNLFPMAGNLPRDSSKILSTLDQWIEKCPEGEYPKISPENL